jgi:hypothetical protein
MPPVVEHVPAVHVEPVPHAWPHVPQLLESVCVSVQVAPHIMSGLVHVGGGAESIPGLESCVGGGGAESWLGGGEES